MRTFRHSVLSTTKPKYKDFTEEPMYQNDGSLLLAYDNIDHDDSLLFKNILIINRDTYSFSPGGDRHIFFAPAGYLPATTYHLKFGYLLASDSVESCYEYHYQQLEVNLYELDMRLKSKHSSSTTVSP